MKTHWNLKTLAALALLPLVAACSSQPPVDANATSTALVATAYSMALTTVPLSMPSPTPVPVTAAPVLPTAVPTPQARYGWNVAVVDEDRVGVYATLKLDQNDMPHIAYLDDGNDDLRYASFIDGAWKRDTFGSKNNDGLHPSLFIDGQNNAYLCRYIGNQTLVACIFGKKWEVQPFIKDVSVLDLHLAIDSKGDAHIVLYNERENDIRYVRLIDGVWQSQSLFKVGKDGEMFPFVLGTDDRPHLAFYDPTAGVKYATLNGGNWQAQVVDAVKAMHPALALDGAGQPHISYYATDTHSLKHAYWDGSTWKTETVDAQGDVGKYSSIAIAPDKSIHISYYDVANGKLKYALGVNGQWNTATLDTEENVGLYTSLALTRSGLPYIAYYAKENRRLKFAAAVPLP